MAPKQLGRYILDRKLATGGMAEIWVAHQHGEAGFAKEVVLKQILPHLAEDPKFIEMFLDEARLAARLSHPNIVQVFDLGEDNGEYYIAMEFIDGRDVQKIVDRCVELGRPFSAAIAARIVADACTALDYAHNFTERDGTHVQLVHRDVSPQNILVSNDGIVKLVDFGVAKAATSTHKTQTGAVKGKLSYMSPEQISGQLVDARSDIFALGIVLYELVTGRRPFGHESELLAITAILNENPTRPCEVIGDLPAELEAVILRALEKDPSRRYQSASEMQMALEQVLRNLGAILTAREVKAYLEDLFSDMPTGTIPALEGIRYADAGAVTRTEHPSASTRPAFTGVPEAADLGGAPTVRDATSHSVASASNKVYLQGALADVARSSHDEPAPTGKKSVAVALVLVLLLLLAGAGGLYAIFGPGRGDATRADADTGEATGDTSDSLATSETAHGSQAGASQAGAPDTASQADPVIDHDPDPSNVALADAGSGAADMPTADVSVDALLPSEGSGAADSVNVAGVDPGGVDPAGADADNTDTSDPAPANAGDSGVVQVSSDAGTQGADEVALVADSGTPDETPEPGTDEPVDTQVSDEPADEDEPAERERVEPRTGTIHVVVSGGRHDIFIDGRRVGSYPGNTRFEVDAGRHQVRVVSADGEARTESVTVGGGDTERVRFR